MDIGAILAGGATNIGGVAVTAPDAANIVGSLGLSFSQLSAAIRAKDWNDVAELTIDDVLIVAADIGLGQPFTGIAAKLLPILFAEGNKHLGLTPDQAKLFPSANWKPGD
jgi:hypothetical protein